MRRFAGDGGAGAWSSDERLDMNDIRRVLRAAAWRLGFVAFLRTLIVVLAVGLLGAIVLRLVQQVFRLEIPWQDVAVYSAAGAVFGALAWTIFARQGQIAVARRVDEGADLREALSTALCVFGQDDPWARVTVESASQSARTVNVRRAVPLEAPRFWPVPLALALTLLVVWLAVPRRTTEKSIAKEKEKAQLVLAKAQVAEAEKKIEEMVSKLNLGDAPKDTPEADKAEAKTPEALRMTAIKKLTAISDRLEQMKQGEKGQKNDSIKEAMKQLKTPGEGPLTEMSKELAKGNFQKASEELTKSLEKLAGGNMSEKDKQAMAEQMKKLGAQLDKLASDRKEVEKALEKAGINKELAKDPAALAEALKKAANLTEEQKKQLAEMAKAMSEKCKACDKMGQCMGQMAASMGQQGDKAGMSQEAMDALQDMGNQLSELEQMAGEMQLTDAAMAEAKCRLAALAAQCEGESKCEGMGDCDGNKMGKWRAGEARGKSNGSGGPGIGRGGSRGDAKTDIAFETKKLNTKTQNGPIIGSRLVEGESIKGESHAEFAAAVAAADQTASEALDSNTIPREYHDAVKHYFGRLKAKTAAKTDAPPTPPAPSADDAGKDK